MAPVGDPTAAYTGGFAPPAGQGPNRPHRRRHWPWAAAVLVVLLLAASGGVYDRLVLAKHSTPLVGDWRGSLSVTPTTAGQLRAIGTAASSDVVELSVASVTTSGALQASIVVGSLSPAVLALHGTWRHGRLDANASVPSGRLDLTGALAASGLVCHLVVFRNGGAIAQSIDIGGTTLTRSGGPVQLGALPPLTTPATTPAPATTTPTTSPSTTTTIPTLPPGGVDVTAISANADASAIAALFTQYFGGIDSQNWAEAYAALGPSLQSSLGSPAALSSADATSRDSRVTVLSVTSNADGSLDANVDFRSHQAAADGPVPGQTCTDWTLRYRLVPAGSGFVIDHVSSVGAGHSACSGSTG
ncbi:MAG: hypothetical protein ACYC1D_14105 [Acidimicrobiales bacterium]